MDQKVTEWIDAHKQDLLEDIKALCAIPSVKAAPLEGKPYGEESYKALNLAIDMAAKYGFTTKNYDNYVGTADYDSALPRTLDILAHTDVVPAGEGWTVTEPFNIIEKDGRLYGRGTSDDKGPMLCALYAMRALKESNVPMKKGIRLIMGSDEETGSSDIEHYYAIEPEAEMTFSPDAEFPLINIEKGQFRGIISKKYEESTVLPRILSLDAGVAFNAVPQKAVIKFEGLDMDAAKGAMEEIAKACEVEVNVTADQEITIIGESAHASTPENGKNAGLAAMMLASKLDLADSECLELVKKIPELFPYGVTDGSGIGIKMCDEESHDLTCTLDLYHVDPTGMEFTFDSRVPVMGTKENCQDVAEKNITAAGFDFTTPGMVPPHRVAGDSDFVQTLLGSYEKVTGLKGECLAIGGGTYVHELKNGVAFGAILPDIDTRMHGADEFMDIDNIMIATKVFADAIWELCGDK
ncbi:MAG: Sapep family Mn(2+)-dependent dipeptidase [Lachnospiraceae bacterium]|nr:Sapep family Mn(2+)-dependent dipeptidase [Lachnospiraceae bacterium]